MTRRAMLATLIGVTVPRRTAAATALHVEGKWVDAATDLQDGYFALCGSRTGMCAARDAIAVTVHPDNALYLTPLRALVGKQVQVSIFAVPD